jgi:hypothetical protein
MLLRIIASMIVRQSFRVNLFDPNDVRNYVRTGVWVLGRNNETQRLRPSPGTIYIPSKNKHPLV